MEIVWELILTTKQSQEEVYRAGRAAFEEEWLARGQELKLDMETEKLQSPRTAMVAAEMLIGYVAARYRLKADYELVSIERPFIVPLDPNDPTLFYIGKIDKIVRQKAGKKRILGIEHKTTTAYRASERLKFKNTFLEGFSPNSQVDGYLYNLHMAFPGEVQGVWVDGALLHKKEEDFTFIPIERQLQHLDAWLWEVRYYIDAIEANIKALELVKPDDKYMAAFPKNTNSCHDFNASCQFLELCKAWANPVGKPTPKGYTLEHWDPLDHIDRSKLEMPK